MTDNIDILDASRDAISIELKKTRQVIAYLKHRGERLEKALAALDAAGKAGPSLPDAESVSRIMDQLQLASRTSGEADGEPAGESKVPEPATESPEESTGESAPPWMFPGDEKKGASEKSA